MNALRPDDVCGLHRTNDFCTGIAGCRREICRLCDSSVVVAGRYGRSRFLIVAGGTIDRQFRLHRDLRDYDIFKKWTASGSSHDTIRSVYYRRRTGRDFVCCRRKEGQRIADEWYPGLQCRWWEFAPWRFPHSPCVPFAQWISVYRWVHLWARVRRFAPMADVVCTYTKVSCWDIVILGDDLKKFIVPVLV